MKNEKSDPKLKLKDDDRITLVGTTKEKKNNISILLRDLEFSDSGKYTCHVRNPKEKDLEHQATIILQVVDKCMHGDQEQGSGMGQSWGSHLTGFFFCFALSRVIIISPGR